MVLFLLMVNLVKWEVQWVGWVMHTDLSWVDMAPIWVDTVLTWVDTTMDLEDPQCRFLAHGLVEQ